MLPLWKKNVFAKNLQLTAPFFEKRRARMPKYGEVLKNMISDGFDFMLRSKPCSREIEKADKTENEQDSAQAEVISEMQKGGLLLTAHYGNFELFGYKLAERGIPLNSAAQEQKPVFFDKYLQKKRAFDGKCFTERKKPAKILEFLKSGGLFAILADQDFRKPVPLKFAENCKSKFLGVPVSCNPLPIFILEHLPNTKVFFGHLTPTAPHALSVVAAAPPQSVPQNIYRSYHDWLENLILKNPSKWYGWFHRRFGVSQSLP